MWAVAIASLNGLIGRHLRVPCICADLDPAKRWTLLRLVRSDIVFAICDSGWLISAASGCICMAEGPTANATARLSLAAVSARLPHRRSDTAAHRPLRRSRCCLDRGLRRALASQLSCTVTSFCVAGRLAPSARLAIFRFNEVALGPHSPRGGGVVVRRVGGGYCSARSGGFCLHSG